MFVYLADKVGIDGVISPPFPGDRVVSSIEENFARDGSLSVGLPLPGLRVRSLPHARCAAGAAGANVWRPGS